MNFYYLLKLKFCNCYEWHLFSVVITFVFFVNIPLKSIYINCNDCMVVIKFIKDYWKKLTCVISGSKASFVSGGKPSVVVLSYTSSVLE